MEKSLLSIKLFLFVIIVIVIYNGSNQKAQTQQKNKMQNQSTADKILSDTLFFTPLFAQSIKSFTSMSPEFLLSIPDKDQPNIEDIIKKYGKADKQVKISRDEFFLAPGVNDSVKIFLVYQYGYLGLAMSADKSEQKVKYVRWKKPEIK